MGKIRNTDVRSGLPSSLILGAIVPFFVTASLCQAQNARSVSAASYVKRGVESFAKGEWDRALADYNIAITFDPNFAAAYLNRGRAQQAKGNLAEALADFDRAIAIQPRLAEAYHIRGLAHDAKGDLNAALADYSRAIELKPRLAAAYID